MSSPSLLTNALCGQFLLSRDELLCKVFQKIADLQLILRDMEKDICSLELIQDKFRTSSDLLTFQWFTNLSTFD